MLALVLSITSCAQKISFLKSSVVPSAEGEVSIEKDSNNNYKLHISVMRLAEPDRLNPSKKLYMAWMETEENGMVNLGQLTTANGFLSKTLKSSLKTVTSFKPVSFMITGENDASVSYPGTLVVLKTAAIDMPD